ncbi:MAG: class C sortase [Oscillospiraceae bacterium]|nr:class C sortase [Oscillospiraceae bacterium]
MKKKILGILIPVLIFLTGLGVLLYPVFSDLWNQHRQNRLMTDYTNTVTDMEDAERNALWSAAVQYNQGLQVAPQDAFTGADPGPKNPYWSLLDPDGTGVMGYLEIPKISLRLPIYHGTGDAALQKGIGHLAGTSLPVGGSGTHCVLSGHRGLPSALLFTDLDQLETGDTFTLYVLDQRLSYQVDQILVVEPEDVSALAPEDGKDYVTLVTCTPYGVNTHRLLVRGSRIEDTQEPVPEVTNLQVAAKAFGWKGKLLLALLGLGAVWIAVHVLRKRRTG